MRCIQRRIRCTAENLRERKRRLYIGKRKRQNVIKRRLYAGKRGRQKKRK